MIMFIIIASCIFVDSLTLWLAFNFTTIMTLTAILVWPHHLLDSDGSN